MGDMTLVQKYLALRLFDIGAVEFSPREIKDHEANPSAPLSPIYFNLRTPDNPKPGPLTEDVLQLIGVELYSESLRQGLTCRHIAGIPNAGNPFVTAFNEAERIDGVGPTNRLYFRKGEAGGKRHIGELYGELMKRGDEVLLIDDLVTKADTKLEAIESVEAAGLIVAGILVLIDREQGGRQQLEQRGYPVIAIYHLSALLAFYVEQDRIDKAKVNEVLTYITANS